MDEPATRARRPLDTRSAGWAQALARALARRRVAPNAISVVGVVFAFAAGAALVAAGLADRPGARAALLVAAAAGIQLRLLCNMLDGMVAIEGGLETPTGELFNELPDRLADIAILLPAGIAAAGRFAPELGWSAALVALFTAYVRMLGGSLRLAQDFRGPMAKPHRMAVLTAACLLDAAMSSGGMRGWAITLGLVVIVLGGALTSVRRVAGIVRGLRAR